MCVLRAADLNDSFYAIWTGWLDDQSTNSSSQHRFLQTLRILSVWLPRHLVQQTMMTHIHRTPLVVQQVQDVIMHLWNDLKTLKSLNLLEPILFLRVLLRLLPILSCLGDPQSLSSLLLGPGSLDLHLDFLIHWIPDSLRLEQQGSQTLQKVSMRTVHYQLWSSSFQHYSSTSRTPSGIHGLPPATVSHHILEDCPILSFSFFFKRVSWFWGPNYVTN